MALWLAAVPSGMAGQPEPAVPNTVLFDTGKPLPGRSTPEGALSTKANWARVPEDNLTHRFQGDAVVVNDRLIMVLRSGGTSAEVYAQTPEGAKFRVELGPFVAGQKATELASLRILENNSGAVMLAPTFTARAGTPPAAYRLAAGQMIVEVRPGEGTGRLLVSHDARYVVIPDFFGNDMVFHAGQRLLIRHDARYVVAPGFFGNDMAFRAGHVPGARRYRLPLPAENFFLTLSDRGNAQIMCVWPSRKQQATALIGCHFEGPLKITGCEIEAVRDKGIWVAVLEGAGMWYERSVPAADAKQDLAMDWKPPFPAKWRTDLLAGDGGARSWYFRKPDEAGQHEPPAGDSLPVCSLEAGRAVLRLRQDPRTAPPAWPYPAPLVVYAMDRDRATPLTTFCPMDVLRNTLGVGPCQYILQTEGLASESNPTPDNVMTWVEKQFSRKKVKKEAEEIHRQLFEMVVHVVQVRARIGRYGRFAAEVQQLCKAGAGRGPDATAAGLGHIAAGIMETVRATETEKPLAEDRATQLANDIIGLEGKADAAAELRRLAAAVRAIGAAQDAALSNCRMAVRWLRASAAMIAEENPQQAELAKSAQARAEKFLAGTEKK